MKNIFCLIICCSLTQLSFAQPIDTTIIPAAKLGNNIWAITPQSVINISRTPSFSGEIITQSLLGNPLKIIAKKQNWHLVQTPDGYQGWTFMPLQTMDSAALKNHNRLPRLIVTNNSAMVYAAPVTTAQQVCEVLLGNILTISGGKQKNGFYKIIFPDGREGFIKNSAVKKWSDWEKSIRLTGSSIEQVARRFTGLPYFWGGTSIRGVDCSGLTKSAYFMHGIILPRDAWQQYTTGVAVDSASHFAHLQKGDLLFFGKKDNADTTKYKIIHTAIYLNNGQFIQAGMACVLISSLNAKDVNYDAYNTGRYVIARRILNAPQSGTWSVFEHPWYN